MPKSSIGVIGLGVMGSSLSLNIAEKGYSISVYNRLAKGEETVVDEFRQKTDSTWNVAGFTEIKAFVNSLEQPRKILIMIKAGEVVDWVLEELTPLLSEGDILIEGGNSHFRDTNRRYTNLKQLGIHLIGCGISGGEEGARKGPSLMPGGAKDIYQSVASILETISAKDASGNPCCTYIGEQGSGHFVKMVHNGIEYAEMQLLAEVYALLSPVKSNEEIATIFDEWNQTDLASYLLEITCVILRAKENRVSVLDTILDKAGNKGTGSWSTQSALDLGTVNTMMSSAVFARYISSFKTMRVVLSKEIERKESLAFISIKNLEQAYRFARIINHHQGFELIRTASETYRWNVNLSEIARIWTNGCIIRSQFIETSVELFKEYQQYVEKEEIRAFLQSSEAVVSESIQYAIQHRIPLDTFWSAYNYWIAITTENLPVNLIQAQRDYFGAHTYQKKGFAEDQFFHTNWTSL
jgi:6-phosphogluconate dehydrogenase